MRGCVTQMVKDAYQDNNNPQKPVLRHPKKRPRTRPAPEITPIPRSRKNHNHISFPQKPIASTA